LPKTIDMYIFKNPKFQEEIDKILTEISPYSKILNLHLEFKCTSPDLGYIWIWTYLDVPAIEIEQEFFRIYKNFFSNEIAYINSESELEGGYQNLFYYDNKRQFFFMDNIAYDIIRMFKNYEKSSFK
jgi:hypothetical protein